jgi:hypothetical protein
MPMAQFEVLTMNGGVRYLAIVDTSRWDFYIGFRRVIKPL